MGFTKFADMSMDDEDILDTCCAMPELPKPKGPQYPYGLRICLNSPELNKLGIEGDCDVGDMIDLRAFAEVTSISKDGDNCRVELQIQKLALENEDDEDD